MGYSPKLWGSEGWHFIHFVALNYPEKPSEEDKNNYYKFLKSLEFTIPCEGCAYNFSEKLKKSPPNLNSRKEFFEWTVDVHNQVNKQNGKKILSYKEAYKKTFKKRDIEILKDSTLFSTMSIAILLLFSYKLSKRLLQDKDVEIP